MSLGIDALSAQRRRRRKRVTVVDSRTSALEPTRVPTGSPSNPTGRVSSTVRASADEETGAGLSTPALFRRYRQRKSLR